MPEVPCSATWDVCKKWGRSGGRVMGCITGETFSGADWLSEEARLPI